MTAAVVKARRRVRSSLRPVVQTAAAAVVAWYLAVLLLPDPRPAFASIAAVVSLGASYGERGQRALQLTLGVVLGIMVAEAIVQVIGTGGLQIGVMVLLAMTAALALGGGELLVSEAAVSAILLVTLDPAAGSGFSTDRIVEAVIGGGVSLVMGSLFFPPDPALDVGRAAQAVFEELGLALRRVATGLDEHESAPAEDGLARARGADGLIRALDDSLRTGMETARLAPPRRRSRETLQRYAQTLPQLDYAVRDTRVLARHACRALRADERLSPEVPSAVRELELAVWELAGAYDNSGRADSAREHAIAAAMLAAEPAAPATAAVTQILGQVRSTAVDLRRAADSAAGTTTAADEKATEELLLSG